MSFNEEEVCMQLSFYEKYVLLTIDDEKGNVVHSHAKTHGFAGAVLIELLNAGLVEVSEKIIVAKAVQTTDPILFKAHTLLTEQNKSVSIDKVIRLFGSRLAKSFDEVITALIDKNILTFSEQKLLWVFTLKRYPTSDPKPEMLVKKRLRQIVLEGVHPELEEIQLLGLVQALDLHRQIFEKDKIKDAKQTIKTLLTDMPVAKSVHKTIQEEIMVVLMASIAVTTVVTAS